MNWPGHHNPTMETAEEHIVKVVDYLANELYRDVLPRLERIEQKVDKLMATLADLQTGVTAEDTVIDSAVALIQVRAAQLAALQPIQAACDSVEADSKATTDGLAWAV